MLLTPNSFCYMDEACEAWDADMFYLWSTYGVAGTGLENRYLSFQSICDCPSSTAFLD